MKPVWLPMMTVALLAFVGVSGSQAQGGGDVYWHVDPSVKTCSMVIDPSLTQEQWHRFNEQAGAIVTFKSLAPATTLGKKRVSVAMEVGNTPIDQHDGAWLNTFAHPDADCPLGEAIRLPALRARVGVSQAVDIGGYWTMAPDANYGVVSGDVRYMFLRESPSVPAAAIRASVSTLTGVPDFDLSTYSVDLVASKKTSLLTPYAGIRQSLVVGTEETSKVALASERNSITQGYLGVVGSLWILDLAAEYDVSTVNTFAFAIGLGR